VHDSVTTRRRKKDAGGGELRAQAQGEFSWEDPPTLIVLKDGPNVFISFEDGRTDNKIYILDGQWTYGAISDLVRRVRALEGSLIEGLLMPEESYNLFFLVISYVEGAEDERRVPGI